jgi:hypothetical protein
MNLDVTVGRSAAASALALALATTGISAAGCGGSGGPALQAGDDASLGETDESDAGNPAPFTMAVGDGGVLQARIQINGAHTTCGTCAVLLAEVQGGTAPYSYVWSDPSLVGPGPHEVCPDAPTKYVLTVTDSSGHAAGELATPAQKAQVTGTVACTAPLPDASTQAGALVGCKVTSTQASEAMDGGMGIDCPANEQSSGLTALIDGGVESSHAGALPGTLLAGQPYSFSYDRVIPLNVGQPVTVDIYGSNTPDICAEGEKLFSMKLDGSLASWNNTYCFTPTKDYAYVVSNVSVQGVFFYNSASFAGTMCTGCSM